MRHAGTRLVTTPASAWGRAQATGAREHSREWRKSTRERAAPPASCPPRRRGWASYAWPAPPSALARLPPRKPVPCTVKGLPARSTPAFYAPTRSQCQPVLPPPSAPARHQPDTSPPLCKSRRVNAQSRCATRSSGTPTTGARTNRRGRRRGRMRRKRGRVVRGSVQAGDRVPGASLSPAPVQCVARLLDEVRLVHGSDTWRQVVSASRQLPSHSTRSILVQSCALRARRRARPRRQQKNYTDEACQGCTPCNNSQRQCARHEGRGELGGHLDAFCHIFGGHVAGCGATGAP